MKSVSFFPSLPLILFAILSVGLRVAQGAPVRFAAAVLYEDGAEGVGAESMAIGDLNGDGITDVSVTSFQGNTGMGSVNVLLGNGDGTFQPYVAYQSGGYYTEAVAIGDVNGDGRPDLIVASGCATPDCSQSVHGVVAVLLGNGDGTLQPPLVYSSGGFGATSVAVGDLNGDGKLDLALGNGYSCLSCANSGVTVLLGNGDGTFQPPVGYNDPMYGVFFVTIGDLNGDGKPDLVATSFYDPAAVFVLLNRGDGTFHRPVALTTTEGFFPASVAIADLNGDRHADLVVASSEVGLSVLLGNGDGTFQSPVNYGAGGFDSASVAVADVNGDAYPDVVVTSRYYCLNHGFRCNKGIVGVLAGNGDGSLQPVVPYFSGGLWAVSAAIQDVNRDGKPDLLVAHDASDTVTVLTNTLATQGTTTTLVASPNPAQVNESVTLTATVTSRVSVPNGSAITFYDGAIKLGTGATSKGVAARTAALSKSGTHTIKAAYPGDLFHKASARKVTLVVNP